MMESIREELESTVTPLVREIFEDARKLMRQEVQLARVELREDSKRARQALVLVMFGGTALFVSLFLCAIMLVYVVATQWFETPLWMAYGIVALFLALIGVIMSALGFRKIRTIRESSGRSLDALREGFTWMQRNA